MATFVKIGVNRIINLDALAGMSRVDANNWSVQYLSISTAGTTLSGLTNDEATQLWAELQKRLQVASSDAS